jgi:hypothetical protein
MKTRIHNAKDAIDAYNENLEGLLSGKRKLPLAKEVNNTLGKLCGVVKMELIHKSITGDRGPMDWFGGGENPKLDQ